MKGTIIAIVIIAVPIIFFGYGGVNNWLVDLEFQREVLKNFEYADRSSDGAMKADYFNKFVTSLQEHGLDKGKTSVFFQEQPNASLEDNFKVAQGLQKRLNEIATMDPRSPEYQFALNQVTLQEFCWFPVSAFSQGYSLSHGAWGDALTPSGATNRCVTKTSSSPGVSVSFP